MDLTQMLQELRSERDQLTEAIQALERLAMATGGGKRRGRPPKWMTEAQQSGGATESSAAPAGPKKRRKFSAETRARMAEAQKARWAEKKADAEAGE
jgi:hypothetical protein